MTRLTLTRFLLLAAAAAPAISQQTSGVCDIGSRRELFVDHYLIERLQGCALRLHHPQLAPPAEHPRPHGAYGTVIKDGSLYRFYYRGEKAPGINAQSHGWEVHQSNSVTLYAESRDGVNWTLPNLGFFKLDRHPSGNVLLADTFLVTHNFTPVIDTRPGVPAAEKYKALGGLKYQPKETHLRAKYGPGGLKAYGSPDGVHWRLLQDTPVIPEHWGAFDSQNVAFWSEIEQRYVCYFRKPQNGLRSISRTTSTDFRNWTEPVAMNPNAPGEHLYTNGTHPYFRAPHIYIALPTRYQAQRESTTDILFMTSRTGEKYDRTFLEAFIRPGLNPDAWRNRSNYAALNVVPTGPAEMSIFVTGGRRYVLRHDGFVSVNAPFSGGEMTTKPLSFRGGSLEINYATSAGGSIRAEIQEADGKPIPGFSLAECPEIVGDEIVRTVVWKGGSLSRLAGKPVRLRFVLQDADLFAIQFQ